MATSKKVYVKVILQKIIEMISEFDFIVSVSKGHLTDLPSPQYFKDIMPIVYVSPGTVHNEYVNQDPRTGLLNQTYNFDIIYVRHNDVESETFEFILDRLMEEGELISEMLMERDTLDDFKTDTGYVLGSLVSEIDFDSNTHQIFKDLEIPASICTMKLSVYHRNDLRR